MYTICEKKQCTGCSACYSICPQNAIIMQENEEGFLYPKINQSLCINCGLCKKVCPSLNYKFNNKEKPECYAAMANDEIRKISSSGGAFTVFANYILSKNGIVCGATYNDNMNVEHIIIDNINDLKKMNGSKYVQSNINNCYKQIKEYLLQDKFVLFSGCPCQVAGLTNYLGKQYDKLLTLDLICHGVPSPLVFKKYLEEQYPNEKITNVIFRDKTFGWNTNMHINVSSKEKNNIKYFENDLFFKLFFSNMSLRKNCGTCNYTKFPRTGDVTIADFWGITKDCNDNKGTSLLFINNNKGDKYFNFVKQDFKLVKRKPINLAEKNQVNLKYPSREHPARDQFFKDIKTKTLQQAYDDNLCNNKNVGILNFHWEENNFGAILTSYALSKVVEDLGYNPQNIDYTPTFAKYRLTTNNPYFEKFRNNYLPRTNYFYYPFSLSDLNKIFSHYIVGSDQVWRYEFIKEDLDQYFLNFASEDKNIIAYATSFGCQMDKNNNNIPHNIYKKYLTRFNSISIREQNGVEYCSSLGLDATHVLDPVFLINNDKWNKIIEKCKQPMQKHKIICYSLCEDMTNDIKQLFVKNKKDLNEFSYKNIMDKIDIGEWLYQIKNSELFITDSFHGSCFAIIFNKPFICINKNKQAIERMKSLFEQLGITNNLYESFDDISFQNFKKFDINYDIVNKKIEKLKTISLNYLKNSLLNKNQKNKNEIIQNKLIISKYNAKQAKKNFAYIYCKYIYYCILSNLNLSSKSERYKMKYKLYQERYKKAKFAIKNYRKLKRNIKKL